MQRVEPLRAQPVRLKTPAIDASARLAGLKST